MRLCVGWAVVAAGRSGWAFRLTRMKTLTYVTLGLPSLPASTMWLSAARPILAVRAGAGGRCARVLAILSLVVGGRRCPHHAERRRWPAMLIGTTRMKCSGSASTHD
jgi:hypothetical protein